MSLLDQIQSHYSKASDTDDFMRYLIKKANMGFSRKGGGKGKSKDKGPAAGAPAGDNIDDDVDDANEISFSWNDSMKQHFV